MTDKPEPQDVRKALQAARDEIISLLPDHWFDGGEFKDPHPVIEKIDAALAQSSPPQDVREKIARALYEQERKRGEHCNAVLTDAIGKPITGAAIEPWEECAENFLSDADAVLAALAQSDAQPVGWRYRPPKAQTWAFTDEEHVARGKSPNDWIVEPLYTTPPQSDPYDGHILDGRPYNDDDCPQRARAADRSGK